MLSWYSNQVWFTWYQGHSYCVRGSGRSEVPWELDPNKTKKDAGQWGNHNSSMSNFIQMNGLHLPCQTGSAQLQALLLPEHKEHPSRPPSHRTSKRFTLQPLFTLHLHEDFADHSNKKKKVRMVPWDQEWILLSCNSLCWLQLSPLTCPYRTCCFHK